MLTSDKTEFKTKKYTGQKHAPDTGEKKNNCVWWFSTCPFQTNRSNEEK